METNGASINEIGDHTLFPDSNFRHIEIKHRLQVTFGFLNRIWIIKCIIMKWLLIPPSFYLVQNVKKILLLLIVLYSINLFCNLYLILYFNEILW